ncbi:MAG: PIN domain-containing protein [Muribaculaceae bacterium]|nr:PIN domain-containing protein [Muribaculaceae bacterium]
MKKIFLDTNIVLDFLIRDEYKSQIRDLISHSDDYDLYISYLTVANAAYIMRKYSKAELKSNIELILELFEIISSDKTQIEKAIKADSPDFEDMLQYQSAKSAKCDVILTRNAKDFSFSDLPVMDVTTFLSLFND